MGGGGGYFWDCCQEREKIKCQYMKLAVAARIIVQNIVVRCVNRFSVMFERSLVSTHVDSSRTHINSLFTENSDSLQKFSCLS